MGGARGDMRADSGHRRQRALEELRDDVLHALGLALGEGAVLPRESGLGKTATHDRRDASLGREPGVQLPRISIRDCRADQTVSRQATCALVKSSGQ